MYECQYKLGILLTYSLVQQTAYPSCGSVGHFSVTRLEKIICNNRMYILSDDIFILSEKYGIPVPSRRIITVLSMLAQEKTRLKKM